MKMALQRPQIIQLCATGIALILIVAFGWLGIAKLMEVSDVAQQLAERRAKSDVAEMMATPNSLQVAKKEISQFDQLAAAMQKKEEDVLGPWRQATLEAKGFGKDWSKDPNKWKDQLVKYNDDILKRSAKGEMSKCVMLATNFYLGLEDFKQKSPREDQVPDLALQMSVSKRLVDLLFQAKESTFEGYPTPCLLVKLQGPLSHWEEGALESKAKVLEKSALKRTGYNVELSCSPEVLFRYLQLLATDRYFFVPTNLSLINEKGGFPKRSELAGQFATPADTYPSRTEQGDSKRVPPPLLKILAGDEKLLINLQLEFIEFLPPESGKRENKPNPS